MSVKGFIKKVTKTIEGMGALLKIFKEIRAFFQVKLCLISSLFIAIVFAFIAIYYDPVVYAGMFNNILGKVILFSIIGLAFVRDFYYGCIVSLFVAILYFVAGEIIKGKEGFKGGVATGSWSKKTLDDFKTYNAKVHPDTQFNLQILQEQASDEEVEEYVKTGYWPWTDVTKKMYVEQAERLQMIRINPVIQLNEAMQLYNEKAAQQLLSWNTKEGNFIINGGLAAYDPLVNDDSPQDEYQPKNIIKCVQDKNGISKMQKKSFHGYNYFNGYKNTKTEDVLDEDIPKEMPGFEFVKGPCNPCGPLENPPEYNCPFTLNIRGKNKGNYRGGDNNFSGKKISPIWEQLWGLKEPNEEEARQFVEKMYDTSDPKNKGFYYGLATGI
uniref:Uncharacterized protein n=1 Tax=viral metagenome TaxID=1070528 RepID=A0A6C0F4U7_9ZZZZ